MPNITFGPGVVAAIRRSCPLPLDTHLMIDEPERYVEAFAKAGRHPDGACGGIAPSPPSPLPDPRGGCRAGVSLNPATPVDVVRHVLSGIDLLLVMTVEPGFGGSPTSRR